MMFSKKSLLLPVALIFTSCLGVSVANAQTSCPYTLASLQGNYALVGTYGANVAQAIGTRSYDGNGNLTGASLINEPTPGSTTGARTLVVAKQVGTYTVNCDGTGQISRVITTNTGITTAQVDDFIITGAIRPTHLGLPMLATAIADVQELPSAIVAGGVFLTRVQTRLPDVDFIYGYAALVLPHPSNKSRCCSPSPAQDLEAAKRAPHLQGLVVTP